jgi:hypothetical protein
VNCARAVQQLLASSNQTAAPEAEGNLQVALTDPPDAFLEIAHEALQLQLGEVQLRRL